MTDQLNLITNFNLWALRKAHRKHNTRLSMNARKTISIEDRFKHSASLEVGQKGFKLAKLWRVKVLN